jgi:hypothetical protein
VTIVLSSGRQESDPTSAEAPETVEEGAAEAESASESEVTETAKTTTAEEGAAAVFETAEATPTTVTTISEEKFVAEAGAGAEIEVDAVPNAETETGDNREAEAVAATEQHLESAAQTWETVVAPVDHSVEETNCRSRS